MERVFLAIQNLSTLRTFSSFLSDNYKIDSYSDEVWLWLWREKRIPIPVHEVEDDFDGEVIGFYIWAIDGIFEENDPEEAIIAAIEYLVDNGRI